MRSLAYNKTTAIPGLSFNPQRGNNFEDLGLLLETGFLKNWVDIVCWHVVINDSYTPHKSNGSQPLSIEQFLESLRTHSQKFAAIFYCQRFGTSNIFDKLRNLNILLVDVKKNLLPKRKQKTPATTNEIRKLHHLACVGNDISLLEYWENLLTSTVWCCRNALRHEKENQKRKSLVTWWICSSTCLSVRRQLLSFDYLGAAVARLGKYASQNKEKWTVSSIDQHNYACGLCNNIVTTGTSAIECDACERWFHQKCYDLTQENIKAVDGIQSILWFCKECLPAAKKFSRPKALESIDKKLDALLESSQQHQESLIETEAKVENATHVTTLATEIFVKLSNCLSAALPSINKVAHRVVPKISSVKSAVEKMASTYATVAS